MRFPRHGRIDRISKNDHKRMEKFMRRPKEVIRNSNKFTRGFVTKLTFLLTFLAFSTPAIADESIRKLIFEGHSYICFNEMSYLHDPDCGCTPNWGAYIYNANGDLIYMIDGLRFQPFFRKVFNN